jgi:hypothetical protein
MNNHDDRWLWGLVLAVVAFWLAVVFTAAVATAQPVEPALVTVADLVASYRQTWALARQRVNDHDAIVKATPEYVAYEAVIKQYRELEVDLTAKVKARTGKTITWATGEMK